MSLLESITEDQKHKAFQKALEKFKFDEGKLVRVTEEYYRAALDFTRDVFLPDEPMFSNVDVRWSPNLEANWLRTFKQGFSLMVINEESGQAVAFRSTSVFKKDVGFAFDQVEDEGVKKVWEYERMSDERSNIFERFGFNEALYFCGLAVHPKYRQRGIAQKIMEAMLYMIKNLSVGSILIKGEASNTYTKRVYDRLGFVSLYELPFDEYYIDGELVFKNTGVHKSQACYGLVVDS